MDTGSGFDGCDPVADPRAVVISGDARFTVLTPAMVRMEHAPGGAFEDRASQAFINRRLPVPAFGVERTDGVLSIRTDELTIRYTEGAPFSPESLSVELHLGGEPVVWRPGMAETGNLRGTTRTLDNVSGSCALEPGLLSRDGWAVVDDSQRPLFDGDEAWNWMAARAEGPRAGDAVDWYFMGYGRDYRRALRDYTRVAGPIPMVPRYVFGSWWSRYWPYTDEELKQIVAEFDQHGVGLDVLVVDMDWHLDGWTGYTWNPRYFPRPEAFLAWCREQGLRVTLNLHPADGVGRHEAPFFKMRAAMGGDRTMYRIPFDCTDRRFMRAYFEVLHHPMEAAGVDFWWMDWQQGRTTEIEGVDPLWWLNHLHWEDMERNRERAEKRPLIFSRWGGLGNHRYQIGFSGDTFNDWESLAFQPYFTATAGNVGYGYWSHDIGGHQPGPVEDELYARWVQYAVFSPVLRTHSGRDPRAERKIWTFRPDCFEVMREAFRFRYELIPYIYSATRQAHDEGISLCRPLYYEWPEADEVYERPGQYLFGDQLMVAPVTRPVCRVSGGAGVDVWVPPGRWTAWFTGQVFEGPRVVRMLVPLDETPILVREGGIVCGAPAMRRSPARGVDPLVVHVCPGEGATRLYEDDGLSEGYKRGEFAWTALEQREESGTRVIRIGPCRGEYAGMARERAYEVRVHGVCPAREVRVNGRSIPRVPARDGEGWWYDDETMCVVISTCRLPVREAVEIAVSTSVGEEGERVMRAGLRGQLALLDDVAAMLDGHVPREVAEARELRGLIASRPDEGVRRAAALQRDWWSLVRGVNACGAPTDAQASALARLLGMSCTLVVGKKAPADGEIDVNADVAFAPRFAEGRDVEVDVSVAASAGWAIASREDHVVETLHVGEHRRVHARLRQQNEGVVGVGTARARVVVREERTEITLESEETFCPSINGWWVLGPFACPFAEQMERDFIDTSAAPDVRASVETEEGPERRWRRVVRDLRAGDNPEGEFRLDLNAIFGASTEEAIDDAVAYASCVLESDGRREVELAIGSDDCVMVWLNGHEIHRNHVNRAYRPREDRVIVALEQGRSTLIVKIGNATQGWFFGAHVDDPTGRPAAGVRVIV